MFTIEVRGKSYYLSKAQLNNYEKMVEDAEEEILEQLSKENPDLTMEEVKAMTDTRQDMLDDIREIWLTT